MGYMQDLLEKFCNDESWNTPNGDGSHRFDQQLEWMESMFKGYAEALGKTPDEIAELAEKGRTFSWPNYYQESRFPGVDAKTVIGVFDTFEDFRKHAAEHWAGYRCPRCGAVSPHPQECKHRKLGDGICDWCSYGLFHSDRGVIVLENGLNLIWIFEPVEKEE